MTFLQYRSLLKVRKKGRRFYSARGFFRYNKKKAFLIEISGKEKRRKKRREKKEKGANDAIRLYKYYR